jgi:hypothetical protein
LFILGSCFRKEPRNSASISIPVRSKLEIQFGSIFNKVKPLIMASVKSTKSLVAETTLYNFYDYSTENSNGV